jgi:excisionase family DNA binding protein
MEKQRKAYSPKQVAAYLGISHSKLYDLWANGDGPECFWIGRNRKVWDDDLEAYRQKLLEEAKERRAKRKPRSQANKFADASDPTAQPTPPKSET